MKVSTNRINQASCEVWSPTSCYPYPDLIPRYTDLFYKVSRDEFHLTGPSSPAGITSFATVVLATLSSMCSTDGTRLDRVPIHLTRQHSISPGLCGQLQSERLIYRDWLRRPGINWLSETFLLSISQAESQGSKREPENHLFRGLDFVHIAGLVRF